MRYLADVCRLALLSLFMECTNAASDSGKCENAESDAVSLMQAFSSLRRGGMGKLPRQQEEYYWPGKNGNLLRTGASPFSAPTNLQHGPTWSFHEQDNGLIRAPPVIDGGKNIYLATIAGNIYKFNEDGDKLWNHSEGAGGIPEVLVLLDGALFATSLAGDVFSLDMETGKELWRTHVAPYSAGDTWSMTAGEGVVIAGGSDHGKANHRLIALDAEDGRMKWTFNPSAPVYNFLACIKDGSLIFSDQFGSPYRLNLHTGHVLWHVGPAGRSPNHNFTKAFSTGGAVIGPNGVVYVTSNIYEKDAPLWQGLPLQSGYVTAFDFKDGTLLWRQSVDYAANNAAAVGTLHTGKLAVVIGVGENPSKPLADWKERKSRVVALDAHTGSEIWRHELPLWHGWAAGDTIVPFHICLPDSFGNPAIAGDGTVYVGGMSGVFYAISDRNGNSKIDDDEVSQFNFSNAFQGSPAIAPGLLIATPCNGMHVFKEKS
jgi:outer membrane protein assembly factor BamB